MVVLLYCTILSVSYTHLDVYKRQVNARCIAISSVKSIKYICRYVNKGSDMAVFTVQNVNENDEIMCYQMGRYISSNEAIWRILSFPIHERDPAVIHLAIQMCIRDRFLYVIEVCVVLW